MTRNLVPWGGNLPAPFTMLKREMDDLFDRFFDHDRGDGFSALPRTDVAETEDKYEISVELPGLKPEDIAVEVKGGELWITGEKKQEAEKKGKTYLRVERQYGRFQHVVPLAQVVDAEKVSAEYQNGVLKISLAKSEHAKPKRIPVHG